MTWLSQLFKRTDAGESIRAKKVLASRAVYTDQDVKERVEVKVEVEDGHTLILDLNTSQVVVLIRNLTAAYEAINPPLRADTRGAWS